MSTSSYQRTTDCCASRPRPATPYAYDPKGVQKETTNGLKYYEVIPEGGSKHPEVVIVVYYDVLGPYNNQTLLQCDRICEGLGVRVVSPDWFAVGYGYQGTLGLGMNFDVDSLWKWIEEVAPFSQIQEQTRDIISLLKREGATKFASIGFCWGAMASFRFAELSLPSSSPTELSPNPYSAFGLLHGRAFSAEDGAKVLVPIANYPSIEEGDQPEFHAALREEGGVKAKSEFKLFADVLHGWSGGRGDWKNELEFRRAKEVIEDYISFVKRVVLEEEA